MDRDEKRFQEITELAIELGLDPFPVVHEIIERSTMFNICTYGLPARARHWSYGRSYDHLKAHGEMGLSKIYEVILNNNPSYAFLLDTNTKVQNLFIVAHCSAHSHVFKNNCMFKGSNRNMIRHAAEHAGRVEEYINKHGFEKVEHLMDIGIALCGHIDWHKGLYRKLYGEKHTVYRNHKRGEFDDVLLKNQKPSVVKKIVNEKFPPHPEQDLLWFFINYAPLEDWEKDILDIIREEHFYFYPQGQTKILHEGFSSYWHAEIMYNYKGITSSEYLDFLRDHEKVVQPGGNPFQINPYYLGFRIFKDIEKRWDESHGKGYGKKKIFEVAAEDDDI
jgi:stage V sporulation protein R